MMNNFVQLLEKVGNLKKELAHTLKNGLNGDGEATSNRAALRELYRKILLTNLEYSLDKKLEQELWNIVFKKHITELQQQIRDSANPKRTEIQNQLTVFLEASSGFYAMLLQDFCHTFDIELPCRVRPSKLSLFKDCDSLRSTIAPPARPSCQYMCQHCLVHLGDIARYRNQNGQAESYYRHAAQVVPTNGQPYNQLAILAAAGGNILSTAFYYCRSLAVSYPFPGSGTNLEKQLSRIIGGEEPRHQKISTSELIKFYLKFHACIYLKKYDHKLDIMVKRLLTYMRAHLRTGSVSRKQLVHMAFLNLFSLNHLLPSAHESGGKTGNVVEENGIDDEDDVPWNTLLSFTVQMLGALLISVPAYSDENEDLEHPALPATKLLLDWFCENDALLRNESISVHGNVWHRLAKVLNALGNQDKANNMDCRPLPEDLEVRGFSGLKNSISKLNFDRGFDSAVNEKMQHPCRCYRLYQLGLIIARTSNGLLTTNEESDGTVFACPLPEDSALEEEELVFAEKTEISHPPKIIDSNRPPRMQKDTGTTSILVSRDQSSHRKGSSESKKDRGRSVKIAATSENAVDSKLKSIQEEDLHQHAEGARSSTASSLDSTCSSPNHPEPSSHHSHKSTHHVTFAPMPPRHTSPDHPSNFKRRSPSPEYTSQRSLSSPDSEFPTNMHTYQADPRNHQHVQRVMQHASMRPMQPGSMQMTGPYPRNFPIPARVIQPPSHMPYQGHGVPPGIPNTVAAVRSITNPPPNPNELPKPIFPTQRMSDGFTKRSDHGNMEEATLFNVRNLEPTSANLAHLAHMQQQQQQQQQMAHLANQRMPHRQPHPGNPGIAARFSNPNPVRMPLDIQAMKAATQQMDPSSVPRNFEALWNQRMQHHQQQQQQQQQRQRNVPRGFPDSNLPGQLGPDSMNMPMQGFNRNPVQDQSAVPYPFNQQARNLFPGVRGPQPHTSSPVDSSMTSSTSSPSPASLGQVGAATSSGSPRAPNLPIQQSLDPNFIKQIIAAQQNSNQHPSQNSSIFGKERPNEIFRGPMESVAVPSTRQPNNNILPPDIFGISPKSGGMAPFGMGSIGQSPANSSPSDPFPPYPLSQEQIYDGSFDILDRSNTNSASLAHQNLPSATASAMLPKKAVEKPDGVKQFRGLIGKEDNESYKLFPNTDHSWTVGGNNRNDNSLGLSNLGSIGSERAMAHSQVPGRYLWNDNGIPSQVANQQQQKSQQMPMPSNGNRFNPNEYQSLWSAPIIPSGPSALEQLIQQQQEHAGHDKTPP